MSTIQSNNNENDNNIDTSKAIKNNIEKNNVKKNENENEESKLNHSLSKLSVKDMEENKGLDYKSDELNDKNSSIIEKYEDIDDDENFNHVFRNHKMRKPLYTFVKREISGYRTGMGEYVPTNHTLPLTNLAISTPGPSDYHYDLGKSGYEYTILGKPQDKNNNIGPGPASVNTRLKEKYPYWTIGQKLYYPKSIINKYK